LVAAGGDISDNGARRSFDVGCNFALGVEEGAESVRKIVGRYVEADRHGK
jgi:hypothetical protein